jgi:hypothetical protein
LPDAPGSRGPSQFKDEKAVALLQTDFAGLHVQLAGATATFNTMLQIVIIFESIPLAAAGVLLGHDNDAIKLFKLPAFLMALVFSGILGLIGYQILVYNRFLITLYSRGLNNYRSLIAAEGIVVNMPVDPTKPSDEIETSGIMVLLRRTLTYLSGSYFAVVAYEIVKSCSRRVGMPWQTTYIGAAIVAGLTFFICWRTTRYWREHQPQSKHTVEAARIASTRSQPENVE